MTRSTDFEKNDELQPGRPVKEAFQDTSGSYPKFDYIGESDTSRLARGGIRQEAHNKGTRLAKRNLKDPRSEFVSEPRQSVTSRYPENDVIETPSGHTIEIDDTPGGERLEVVHRTGSRVAMLPNGDIVVRSAEDSYHIVAGDQVAVIRGNVKIVVESSASLRIQGDLDLEVEGDLNQTVHGDWNLEVAGSRSTRIHGDNAESVTGGRLEETRGNVIRRNLANLRERTVGDHDHEVGGTYRMTAEIGVRLSSYGPFQGSFYGGLLTMDGKNKDGEEAEGSIRASFSYAKEISVDEVMVSGQVSADSVVALTMEAPTFEGVAKKADYATTAGTAGTGPSVPTTPSPGTPTARDDGPLSSEAVIDVSTTSEDFIKNLDRLSVNEKFSRILGFEEASSRCRNPHLRNDSKWLQDQVDTEAVLSSITSAGRPKIIARGSAYTTTTGSKQIGAASRSAAFLVRKIKTLVVKEIPAKFQVTDPRPSSLLAPGFTLAQMLAGDASTAKLQDQVGLTADDIFSNLQALAFNVLIPLRDKYRDKWTISEGLYNPYEEEDIEKDTLTAALAQGLGVGIQMLDQSRSTYLEVAQWLRGHVPHDSIVISYIDYDPQEINEPTLLVTLGATKQRLRVRTEFNHQTVEEELLELDA